MSTLRMIFVVVSICACLIGQTIGVIQYPNIDEDTNCPIGVAHNCTTCAEDGARYGCYCEPNGVSLVTANIFTPCVNDTVDPCTTTNCQNGATCVRTGVAAAKCVCAAGWGGTLCDTALPKCTDPGISCPNAECVETNDPALPVYCACYDGTRRNPTLNVTCPTNPCYEPGTSVSVCQNGGTCRIVNNAYVCECTGGYAGQNCTKLLKTPLCENLPGVCGVGTCQQALTPPYYTCNCGAYPSTFGAANNELVKCEDSGCYASNPCLNGGTCSNNNKIVGAFICQCPPRYTGAKCEKQSACFNNPCLNGGICEAVNETTYYCGCPAYYTGQRCETAVPNPCIGSNCGPYGECEDNAGVAVCRCNDGVHAYGSPCQDPCLTTNCGPGVCTRKANATYTAYCACPIDRTGDFCEQSRDVCRVQPRCGGGYCKPAYTSTRGYTCVCAGGVISPDPCPFSATCPITTCGTKGVCVETDGIIVKPGDRPIYYVCSCQQGYISATNCDDVIDNQVPTAAARCGPQGRPYPSRNPNNPIGCWCNNGTQFEEIDYADGPAQYCV